MNAGAGLVGLCLAANAASPAENDAPPPKVTLSGSPTTQDIFRARVFEEPLVPVGGEPDSADNGDLAASLQNYSKRNGPDDFASLTGFMEKHPHSPWRAALLTDLGFEYYNTAHYSLALDAWKNAWALAKDATGRKAKAIADRAGGELAYMYARLGRMTELEAFFKSVEGREFVGAATERIAGAREGLWNMQNRPEISFRCGPLALQRIRLSLDGKASLPDEILHAASTQQGCSLPQVADLSEKVGLNYQMAFRESDGEFIVPSVVHWKVGHYAALLRKEGDRYLLEDPTFGNNGWATRQALEAETSGYFLVPPDQLSKGWRKVDALEGGHIWGKGQTASNDPRHTTPKDPATPMQPCSFAGMAVPRILLMLVSLNINDDPVGYTPPFGPNVRFTVRYNHRDAYQPANFTYSNFGPKWTCDWISYIQDNPTDDHADVMYYARGGGVRTFTNFFRGDAFEKYDQSELIRTSSKSYEMIFPDGSRLFFDNSDGSTSSSRKIFLSHVMDPQGNVANINYDSDFRITSIVDASSQVTTFEYGLGSDMYKITKVTDPFGRFATFDYDDDGRLSKITDVIGITSQFTYQGGGDFISSLTTPYGVTHFTSADSGNTRVLEILYPDNSRERVEYNQGVTNLPMKLLAGSIPVGMATHNDFLQYRSTYYWSRAACAIGYGDYSKARLYHWLHTEDLSSTAGALESVKEPLEGRVWFDYSGQADPIILGANNRPTHVGRVLDDGTTQLYSYSYNNFGLMTSMTDPVGRKFSNIYASNGIDLLEVRQTRAGKNELLTKVTYNSQHRPLTRTDAAGQTTTFTYNSRGQVLSITDAKNETISFNYDINGHLTKLDGPLPGASDSVTTTYDAFGRPRTITDVNGYTVTLDYDAAGRIVKTIFGDGTFNQYTYDRLDISVIRDRAGRETRFEHDSMRQITKVTDPIGRATTFEWCSCGDPKSMIDPLGRTTVWTKDVQGRRTSKTYGDGSQVRYVYEASTSRLQRFIDENHQVAQYSYHKDNSMKSLVYLDSVVPTAAVSYTYDPDYKRITSISDGSGITTYSYNPISAPPALGAGKLASIDGPLTNDTLTFVYDELGRNIDRAVNGVDVSIVFDELGRLTGMTNALGVFSSQYEGASRRMTSESFPNSLTTEMSYFDNTQDRALERITHKKGATPVAEFLYGQNVDAGRIATWSQQTGAQPPDVYSFTYDDANQLLSASVTNSGVLVNQFAYAYDAAGNRLSEQVGSSNYVASYNALNEVNTTTAPGVSRTNEWDAAGRLAAVNAGNQRTEFTYDGWSRMVGLRHLANNTEVSRRLFVWNGLNICEERDTNGTVMKRFFGQGVKLETGPAAGIYFYTRDHLGSIREVLDAAGNVRASYSYDPYGRRTKLAGDLDADFGYAGMFWSPEANLSLTPFRAYDAGLGRWLSRDPLENSELKVGPNLYTYVGNNPINLIDPDGLCPGSSLCACFNNPANAAVCTEIGIIGGAAAGNVAPLVQTLPSFAPQVVNTVACAAPAIESALPEIEASLPALETATPALETAAADLEAIAPDAEVTLTGAEYEDYLVRWGELGRSTLGSNAREALRAFNRYVLELAGVYPGGPSVSIDVLEQAHQKAVATFGFDPTYWRW